MTTTPFQQLKQKYGICSAISLGALLLGLIAAIVCNFAIGSAYLGFILGASLYALAAAYQLFITVKALKAGKQANLEAQQHMELTRFTCRLCGLVLGCAVVLTAVCSPLIILPWAFDQQIIAIGWLEFGWLPSLIALGVCGYLWWFLDTTAIIKGYWKHRRVARKVQHTRKRYVLIAAAAMLVVLLVQLVFNSIRLDTLAGGNTFYTWEDFVSFMQQPRDEWDNYVERDLDEKTLFYAQDGTTVLCEYFKMNYSVHHISYREQEDQLPITVYTNMQMDNAETLQSNLNLVMYALYLVIPIAVLGYYFWKFSYQKQPPKG